MPTINWGVVLLISGAVAVSLVAVLFIRRYSERKWLVYLPSIVLSTLVIVFAILASLPVPAGSWLDLVYAVFASLSLVAAVITLVITALIDFNRRRKIAK